MVTEVLYRLGVALLFAQRFDQALQRLENARQLFMQLGDGKQYADVTTNIGTIHAQLGNSELALACFDEAFRVYEQLALFALAAHAASNVSTMFTGLGDKDRADMYRDLARKYNERGNGADNVGWHYFFVAG